MTLPPIRARRDSRRAAFGERARSSRALALFVRATDKLSADKSNTLMAKQIPVEGALRIDIEGTRVYLIYQDYETVKAVADKVGTAPRPESYDFEGNITTYSVLINP